MENMNDADLKEVVATGERLPGGMFNPDLLREGEEMALPVFNGNKVVDQAGE